MTRSQISLTSIYNEMVCQGVVEGVASKNR